MDLWEVGCRWDLFPVVSREKLPHIANSDFHRPEHLYAWKTLLKAEKSVAAVLDGPEDAGTGIGVLRLTPRVGGGDRVNASAIVCLLGLLLSVGRSTRPQRRRSCGVAARPAGRAASGLPPAGLDREAPLRASTTSSSENLESFYRLDYPEYEVVFSFARRDDPGLLRRAARRRPPPDDPERLRRRRAGAGRQLEGQPPRRRLCATRATGYILFADGNVRVDPEFLAPRRLLVLEPVRRPRVPSLPRPGAPEPSDRGSSRST